MKIKNIIDPVHIGSICINRVNFSGFAIPDNLYFHGILVDEPCTIKPGDETVVLDFGNIPDKTFMPYKERQASYF